MRPPVFPVRNEVLTTEKAQEIYSRQQQELEHDQCQPTFQCQILKETLPEHSKLIMDWIVEPLWVRVLRCPGDCSGCREPGHVCLPTPGHQQHRKTVVVIGQDDNQTVEYHRMFIKEDSSCTCQRTSRWKAHKLTERSVLPGRAALSGQSEMKDRPFLSLDRY